MDGDTVPPKLRERCEMSQQIALSCLPAEISASSGPKIGIECLIDTFMAIYEECQVDTYSRNKNVAAFLRKYQAAVKKLKELQIKPSDFKVKATIGHGHFGEVQVVHEKTTDTVYAMKILRKVDMLSQPDISFFEEERDIMAGANSPWLTKLHFAFQDHSNLYLVMDFHCGGDLLSLLSRHGDQFEEEMARFYLAEMALAINDLHQMGYLHRDIKPENVLLDQGGHIKLADFGSAARMNVDKMVASRMPVGTPDYVAPELLDSMNRASRSQRYSVEVDWWSLGICAYEMLFGCTPFTDDDGSMVTTYSNIMNFQNKLKFPPYSSVSGEARDLISKLLTDTQSRLTWSQIKQHPFFKDICWDTIRNTSPPFVPSVSSLDDTSHFDEVEKPKPPPNVESLRSISKEFSGRHLPFVGFTFSRCCEGAQRLGGQSASPQKSRSNSTVLSELDSSLGLNTARYISAVESCTSLTSPADPRPAGNSDTVVTVTVAVGDLQELRAKCQHLQLRLEAVEVEKAVTEKELTKYINSNQMLKQKLEENQEMIKSSDQQCVEAWLDLQAMNSQISSIEDQMLSCQLDELREIIVQLETEQESLTRRLLQKDHQLESLTKSLSVARQQLDTRQYKLDKERRKSRENQKQSLVALEAQEEAWLTQLQEKQATIDELTRKVRDLEDLITAYEEMEDEQAGELQQLQYKLNTSLLASGLDTSSIEIDKSTVARMEVCPSQHNKKVSVHVTLRPGRPSVKDHKSIQKLKELQAVVDRYAKEVESWRQKENTLQKKVNRLEAELQSQCHKEGLRQQTKDSLMGKLNVYQQEVHMQRNLIQELQKKMRSYLDEQTTITQTEAKLKEVQCQNLELEANLFTVKQEAEQRRQLCMDKTREMEEVITKLEAARRQVQEYQDKYSKEVENTELRTQELEQQVSQLTEERGSLQARVQSLLEQSESLQGMVDEGRSQLELLMERNTQLQSQLQDYTQRNSQLLKQVESLQKVHKEDEATNECQSVSRAELNTQLNRLQQTNDELQRQLLATQRQRSDLEATSLSLQHDAERLHRRITRLEEVETEKRLLEGRLERMGALERDNKRLELRLSRLEDLEQEKAHMELKMERLETEARTLKLEAQTAQEELCHLRDELERQSTQRCQQAQSPASRRLMVDLLHSEKQELERQVAELQQINISAKELKAELGLKEEEIKELSSRLKVMEEELSSEKDEACRRTAQLESETAGLRARLSALESKLQEREGKAGSEIMELKAKVRSLEDQLKLRERLVKGEDQRRVSGLSQELREAKSQLQAKTRDCERLEVELKKVRAQTRDCERLEVELREVRAQTRDCERLEVELKKVRAQTRDCERLEVDLREARAQTRDCERLEVELREAKTQLQAKSRDCERLDGEKRDLLQQVAGNKTKAASSERLEREKKELEQKLTDLKAKASLVERLEKEKRDLEQQIADQKTKAASLEHKPSIESRSRLVDRLQTDKAELQRKVESLEKEMDTMRDKMGSNVQTSGGRDSFSLLQQEGAGSRLRAQLEDKVQRLERVVRELEKKLEISAGSSVDKETLRAELEAVRRQIRETAEAEVVPKQDYDSLRDIHTQLEEEVRDLRRKLQQLQDQTGMTSVSTGKQQLLESRIHCLEKENSQVKSKVSELEVQRGSLQRDLIKAREEVEKGKKERTSTPAASGLLDELTKDKQSLEVKVSCLEGQRARLEEQLEQTKAEVEKEKRERSALLDNALLVTKLKQENQALEGKVSSLQQQLDSHQKRRQQLEQQSKEAERLQEDEAEVAQGLRAEVDSLRLEKASLTRQLTEAQAHGHSLAQQVNDLMTDASKLREEVSRLKSEAENRVALEEEREALRDGSVMEELKKTNAYLTTKAEELERHLEVANKRPTCSPSGTVSRDALVAELRNELHESNLAVSEARSLLSANKRIELELRAKVGQLQRVLDNGALLRANNIQLAAGAEQELRVLRSQYETLQRQYKKLEEQQSGSHRDKAGTVMELTLMNDQLQTKQQQLELQTKKNQKLAALCVELEEQVKDMEGLVADKEAQQEEWDQLRQSYEAAMRERQQELEGASQQLQAATSVRAHNDQRVGQLTQELQVTQAQHHAELDKMGRQLKDERAKVHKMAEQLANLEEKERRYQQMVATQGQSLQVEKEVMDQLKEEVSAKTTEIEELKASNLKLKKHLDQAMDKFEIIFGQKVSLENFNEVLQGLRFLEKYKFESTIGQQMKLIDYLQELYMENAGKKKKGGKRVGSGRGKDSHPIPGLPLEWTDLQTALDQEQKKRARLQEQVDRLREENFSQANELLKLKGPLKERAADGNCMMNPVKQSRAVATLVQSPSAQPTTPAQPRRRGYYAPPQPTPQRMRHNIPHRFVTGLNTRATKCGLCLGSVHFVKQASKCQECGMVVHPKCAPAVPATCGLPTEYVRHFADMMSRIEEAEMQSDPEPVNIKMEGWLKVPRTGKPGWEKRWVELDGHYLMLYKEDTDANPVDTFDLSPPDAEVSVHSAVTAAELTNTAALDLYYVLRLDQDPLTTCWPGRYLYLMTTNFVEKQRWVASLEAAVRSYQRQDRLSKSEPLMTTVVSLKESERKEFNCALALSPQLVLLGTDDGLFGLNPQSVSGRQHLVQLSGFGSVHQMAEAKGVNLIILLTGPERKLVLVDSKLIKCRMSQTIGGETTPFSHKDIEGIQRCTIFSVAVHGDSSYLIVGMPDKVVLLKYNPALAMYCVRKEMPCTQPCSCICMADGFAIVGTERFYRISLEHPSLIDFVDRQDSTLAFAAFGAANHHSFPLAVVQVSPDGLPLEFLLCFHEFGVFVDHRGQRSRQSDVKWSGLPLSFLYTEPFLYITYFNSVQATVVPTDKEQVKGCQTAVDLPAPRNLGAADECGAVYIASSSYGVTEVILVQARDQRKELPDDDDKENFLTRTVRFAPSPDKGYGNSFTVKTSVSLLSLDSIDSASTLTSVESTF